MNAILLEKRCKEIESEYPIDKCNVYGTKEEAYNYHKHAELLYSLARIIANEAMYKITSRKSTKKYAQIIKKYEHYNGEAGLNHFGIL